MSNLSSTSANSSNSYIVVSATDAPLSVESAENRQKSAVAAVNNEAVALCTVSAIPQHSYTTSSHSLMPPLAPDGPSTFSPPNWEVPGQNQSTVPSSVPAIALRTSTGASALSHVLNGSSNFSNNLHGLDNSPVEISPLGGGILGQKTSDSVVLDSELLRILQQQQCDAVQVSSSLCRSLPILQLSDSLSIFPNQHMPDKTTISSLVSHDLQPGKNSISEPSFHTSTAPPFTQQFSVLPSGPGGAPAKKKQQSGHINTDNIPPVSLNPISTNPQITILDPQPDLTSQKPDNISGRMDIASSSHVLNKEGPACSNIQLQTGPTHTVALPVEPTFNCHFLNEECPTPTFPPSSPLHNHSSQANSKQNDSQSVESFVPNTEPEQSSPKHKQNSQHLHSITNRFAPLSSKFWGDEEEEPPIQTFVHSADEIMEETEPHQCIQLGEDIDQSVLNQETPENMKNTCYLSSLYSDSSPSLNYNIHSPTDSSYSPLKDSDQMSSSPSIPLLTYTTSKAKNKQARKIQKEMEDMVRAGVPQASIDWCYRNEPSGGPQSQESNAHDQLCDHGILGNGSSPLLTIFYSVQHSIQSAISSVAILADYADFSAATVLCPLFIDNCFVDCSPSVHKAIIVLSFLEHNILKNWLFCKALGLLNLVSAMVNGRHETPHQLSHSDKDHTYKDFSVKSAQHKNSVQIGEEIVSEYVHKSHVESIDAQILQVLQQQKTLVKNTGAPPKKASTSTIPTTLTPPITHLNPISNPNNPITLLSPAHLIQQPHPGTPQINSPTASQQIFLLNAGLLDTPTHDTTLPSITDPT
ncbi:hypothetical protein LguiB_027479 [Lonicera macranthoides]